jgi:hypothetical protein
MEQNLNTDLSLESLQQNNVNGIMGWEWTLRIYYTIATVNLYTCTVFQNSYLVIIWI